MAICKIPRHNGGRAPALGRLIIYLAREEKREIAMFLSANGEPIEVAPTIESMGGYHGRHWHAIVAPSANECRELFSRYGKSIQHAAIEHGKRLSQQLQSLTQDKEPPKFAIHFESIADESFKFHYHYVGTESHALMRGQHGAIQKAWNREWSDRRPVTNWKEHQEFKRARRELRALQKEQRQLDRDRYKALTGASLPKHFMIRLEFSTKERAIIDRRFELETAAINHRYASRGDLNSPANSAEIENAIQRKTAAVQRLQMRGASSDINKTSMVLREKTGRAISLAKRTGRKASVASLNTANSRYAKDLIRKFQEAGGQQKQDSRAVQEGKRIVRPIKGAAVEAAKGITKVGAEITRAAVAASTKLGIRTATATAKLAVGLVLAIPTGGASLSVAAKEAGQDLATGGKEAAQEAGRGIKNSAKEAAVSTARTGLSVGKAVANIGVGSLPGPLRSTVNAGAGAAKTASVVAKNVAKAATQVTKTTVGTATDLIKFDVKGAVKTLAVGSLETSKHLLSAGAAIQIKDIPAPLKIATSTIEKVPIIGVVGTVARLSLEATAAAAAVAKTLKKSASIDLSR